MFVKGLGLALAINGLLLAVTELSSYVYSSSQSRVGGAKQLAAHISTQEQPITGFCNPLSKASHVSQGPNGNYTHQGRMQYAYDYAVDIGTPVFAMQPGKVIEVVDRYPDTGGGPEKIHEVNYILIDHGKNYRSAYLHLRQGFQERATVRKGDRVKAGDLIGYSGNSGWSTGAHLHVEVHKKVQGTFGQTIPFTMDSQCHAATITAVSQ